jgi:hypothetical protein
MMQRIVMMKNDGSFVAAAGDNPQSIEIWYDALSTDRAGEDLQGPP